jgi:hypothetical protein
MKAIPISATPSQKLSSVLGGQNCQFKVYQKTTGLYVDVYVNNAPIVQGAIARDRVRIVRHAYLGFVGDLAFVDTQGTSDPESTGLGSRYAFIYLEASDL